MIKRCIKMAKTSFSLPTGNYRISIHILAKDDKDKQHVGFFPTLLVETHAKNVPWVRICLDVADWADHTVTTWHFLIVGIIIITIIIMNIMLPLSRTRFNLTWCGLLCILLNLIVDYWDTLWPLMKPQVLL